MHPSSLCLQSVLGKMETCDWLFAVGQDGQLNHNYPSSLGISMMYGPLLHLPRVKQRLYDEKTMDNSQIGAGSSQERRSYGQANSELAVDDDGKMTRTCSQCLTKSTLDLSSLRSSYLREATFLARSL